MVDTVDFIELLDLAKQASGAASDSDLSRKLGVSRQSVSNWRNSNKFPDTVTCATIAGITGVPLARVLGIVGEARATDQKEKAVWRRLAGMAMALAIGVGLASPAHVQAAETGVAAAPSIHYAKWHVADSAGSGSGSLPACLNVHHAD